MRGTVAEPPARGVVGVSSQEMPLCELDLSGSEWMGESVGLR